MRIKHVYTKPQEEIKKEEIIITDQPPAIEDIIPHIDNEIIEEE